MQHRQVGINRARFQENLTLFANLSLLEDNTTNEYGVVNGSSVATQVNDLSNPPNAGNYVGVGLNYILNGYGAGLASLQRGAAQILSSTSDEVHDWDDEFWVSLNFKHNITGANDRCMFSMASNTTGGSINFVVFDGKVGITVIHRDPTTVIKRYITDLSHNDNTWKKGIFHFKGINDMANSKIYIDGIEQTLVEETNQSLSGRVYNAGQSRIAIRADISVAAFSGELGGTLMRGYGAPNVNIIQTYL